MRSTLLTRHRSDLKGSKNTRIRQIAKQGAVLASTDDSSVDWNQVIAHFRELIKIEFTERGEIQTSNHNQAVNSGWSLHHRGITIDKLPSEGNEKPFSVTYHDLHLKNKKNIAINIPGELKLWVVKDEKGL